TNPLNCLSGPVLPTSTASLVLAKSNGYTTQSEAAPAAPPEATFPKKNFAFWVFLSNGFKYLLNVSLKAKFNACVGKYLITFAKLPLHKLRNPCSFTTLAKQSPIPLYLLSAEI